MFWAKNGIRNIKRHRKKAVFNLLICLLAVLLLHVYEASRGANEAQFDRLVQAMPVKAEITSLNGSQSSGLVIKQEVVDTIEKDENVTDFSYSSQLWAGEGTVAPAQIDERLDIPAMAANRMEAVKGMAWETVRLLPGEQNVFMRSAKKVCMASERLMEERGWKLGDTVELSVYCYVYNSDGSISFLPLDTEKFQIVASYGGLESETAGLEPRLIFPMRTIRRFYGEAGREFEGDSVSFRIQDPLDINSFKERMKALNLLEAAPTADARTEGNTLVVWDAAFLNAAERLEKTRLLLNTCYPFLLALLIFVGYLVSYLMVQDRVEEYAVMRCTGSGKASCFASFFLEYALEAGAGGGMGSILAAVLLDTDKRSLGAVLGLFLLCYLCGTGAALWRLGRIPVMEVLTKND